MRVKLLVSRLAVGNDLWLFSLHIIPLVLKLFPSQASVFNLGYNFISCSLTLGTSILDLCYLIYCR